MFGHMKDPVVGTATLVSYTETSHAHRSSTRVSARVTLHAPGLEPQSVEVHVRVPRTELPLTLGEVWNVEFDRTQPSHVKFAWAVSEELDDASQGEVDRELRADEVRVLKAGRRRASK
jgi:hypothetical protein